MEKHPTFWANTEKIPVNMFLNLDILRVIFQIHVMLFCSILEQNLVAYHFQSHYITQKKIVLLNVMNLMKCTSVIHFQYQ